MTPAVSRRSLIVVGLVVVALVVPQVSIDRSAAQTSQVATVTTSSERHAQGGARHPSVGVVDHALWGDRTMRQRREMLQKISRVNAGWVRIGLPWALVQPNRPSSKNGGWTTWAFDRIDAVVRAAKRNNLRVSITLVGTPKWANGGLGGKYLPDNPATYGRAIARLSRHYRGDVQSWEIWNEANHLNYLKGATVREYKRVLCAAYPAVKRNAPGATVVSAGTAGVDVEWIRKLYRLGGKKCFDVLAVHPYTGGRSPRYSWNDGTPRWLAEMHQARRSCDVMVTRTPASGSPSSGTRPSRIGLLGESPAANRLSGSLSRSR